MSTVWSRYLDLLEESASLTGNAARRVAEADAAYDAEARRLQNDLALAERDLKTLRDRNSRLQVGVRDVIRSVGVAGPATSGLPSLAVPQLRDALKAAEYDLDQIRKSLEYVKAQREAARRQPPPPAQPPPPVPTATVSGPATSAGERSSLLVPVLLGSGALVIVLIVLAVILL